jgi:hypothetical protein
MELMLKSWCELHGLRLNHGLIQNDVAVSLSAAKQEQPVCYALRWRYRECRSCHEEFDIQNGGFLYTCHGCAPVVSDSDE